MYKHKIYNKYEALGFIEALMAILVAGITSIVLMSVAIDTIKQTTKNELSDKMTQQAIEGASMVKTIASLNNESPEKIFPQINGNVNNCYILQGSITSPEFYTEGSEIFPVCNYDSGGRETCKEATTSDNLFQVFCITNESDPDSGLVVGKMIIGNTKCNSSENCDIPDYQYFVLAKTKQR